MVANPVHLISMLWLRPTLDGVPGSKFLGTNLDPFGKLNPWVGLYPGHYLASWVLQIMSSPFELFFWVWTNWFFGPKWCHVGLASNCHFLVLDPHLKGMGPIYGSPPIGLLYWTLDPHLKGMGPIYGSPPIGLLYWTLDPHLKWP
jgi:hypothetical protein